MPSHLCPKGHSSEEPDFCSECGAKIQSGSAEAQPAAPEAPCPDCGGPRPPDQAIFCEVCGYNFDTGAHGEIHLPAPVAPAPTPAPAPAPVPAVKTVSWTAVVAVDPSRREAGSPEAPADAGEVSIALDKPVNLIGRTSAARAIHPEVALDRDDAVSHRHALLTVASDGSLTLRDIGSSNGTRLNGNDLLPMTDAHLSGGAEISLGHWTRITIKAAE